MILPFVAGEPGSAGTGLTPADPRATSGVELSAGLIFAQVLGERAVSGHIGEPALPALQPVTAGTGRTAVLRAFEEFSMLGRAIASGMAAAQNTPVADRLLTRADEPMPLHADVLQGAAVVRNGPVLSGTGNAPGTPVLPVPDIETPVPVLTEAGPAAAGTAPGPDMAIAPEALSASLARPASVLVQAEPAFTGAGQRVEGISPLYPEMRAGGSGTVARIVASDVPPNGAAPVRRQTMSLPGMARRDFVAKLAPVQVNVLRDGASVQVTVRIAGLVAGSLPAATAFILSEVAGSPIAISRFQVTAMRPVRSRENRSC